jgi:hypothetical protein
MADLTVGDFTAGTVFEVPGEVAGVPLRLERVEELPRAAREAGAFRLEFSGPAEPLLPQAIYPFEVSGSVHGIFIVPLAQDGRGTRYEAIFN